MRTECYNQKIARKSGWKFLGGVGVLEAKKDVKKF